MREAHRATGRAYRAYKKASVAGFFVGEKLARQRARVNYSIGIIFNEGLL